MTRRRRSNRRGSSTVEFALTAPAFVLVLAIFIDYGWVFFQKAMLDNAIQSGCRQGAITDPETADPMTVADGAISSTMSRLGSPCDGDCTITLEDRGATPALSLYCEVDQEYTPLFGMVPTPDRLQSSTLMRFEWQDEVDEFLGGP